MPDIGREKQSDEDKPPLWFKITFIVLLWIILQSLITCVILRMA